MYQLCNFGHAILNAHDRPGDEHANYSQNRQGNQQYRRVGEGNEGIQFKYSYTCKDNSSKSDQFMKVKQQVVIWFSNLADPETEYNNNQEQKTRVGSLV